MPDKFSAEVRSRIMAAIKSKNTKLELIVFRELVRRKVYFQRHHRKTAGSPDICLPKRKIAVFIDGDFWHGYRYSRKSTKLPSKYWIAKIENNIARDKRNFRKLRRSGWKVMRVWEHQLNRDFINQLDRIEKFLKATVETNAKDIIPVRKGSALRTPAKQALKKN
jgi:DNA mismatch endonuclease, patch repair protein